MDGRIVSAEGAARFLNISDPALIGRDLYLFFERDRHAIQELVKRLPPTFTVERDAVVRPRERKPFTAHTLITRREDDLTIEWRFRRADASDGAAR